MGSTGVEVVVDDDDRRARGRQGGDEGVELLPAGDIDGAGWLVEHEELWAHGQGDGERESLTLSARERPGVVPDALDESHRTQGLLDRAVISGLVRHRFCSGKATSSWTVRVTTTASGLWPT